MNRTTMTRGEIEIIGGGLAGLSLGLALRRSGIPVTIHEAGAYPRHRVCGEFITGLAAATIERLGLGPILGDALLHREVAWQIHDREPQIQRLPAPALGISRYQLDARLAEEFVRAGGVLHSHSRISEEEDAAGRVFATGRRRVSRSPWIGLKIHARGLALTRDLEMHLGEQCYVGLSRVEEDLVNVCGLFRRRATTGRGHEVLFAYLNQAGLHALAERLGHATLELDSFSAVAALGFDRGQHSRGRFCVGDAAAAIPPFTGNGMAMAFQSAELALDPLTAYAKNECGWRDARNATHAALRGRFRVRLASAHALHPFLLRPQPQRWFAALSRVRLIPFRPLYASLH